MDPIHLSVMKAAEPCTQVVEEYHYSPAGGGFHGTYLIKLHGQDYVFKLDKFKERVNGAKQCGVITEAKALLIAKINRLRGVTHLVKNYGEIGDFNVILKEYAPGKQLDQCNGLRLGAPLRKDLRHKISRLHQVGIAGFVDAENIIVSPDGLSAKIIDLGESVFGHKMSRSDFVDYTIQDNKHLNAMLNTYCPAARNYK